MAERQEAGPSSQKNQAGDTPVDPKTPNSAKPDKEERLRILRERQNEERQRKLEEIKQQAMAAQKFREQKEEERRRRLEELRVRDSDRRLQVEERKRQIWEAERDRREAILRKNQEREARLETKRRNERSSIVFAFGSSTPRMLEPGDTGSAYWATRRATSTTNVMTLSLSATQPGPLTRRSSERELDGSKKRATSAGGIERKPLDGIRMSSSIYEVLQWGSSPPSTPVPHKSLYPLIPMESDVRRKKTDLSPVLRTAGSSSGLIGATGGSGDSSPRGGGKGTKPGRAYSMSRLDLLSRPVSRASLSAVKEPTAPVGPPPLRRGAAVSMVHLAPPRPTRAERLRKKAREQQAARSQSLDQPTSPGGRSGEVTPSRPTSSLSQASVASQLSAASLRMRTTPRKPRPASIAVTGVSSPGSDRGARSPNVSSSEKPPPIPKVHSVKKATPSKIDNAPKKPTKSTKSSTSTTPKGSTTPLQSPMVESGPQEESSGGAGEQSGSEEKTAALPHADCSNGPQPVAAGGGDLVSGVGGAGECHPTDTTSQSTLEPPPVLQISVGEASAPSGQQPSEVPSLTAAPSASVPPPEQATESKSQPVESKSQPAEPKSQPAEPKSQPSEPKSQPAEPKSQALTESGLDLSEVDMTASMMARTRITTEEEAKAALAERRRLAREQAEREAELERQRLEAERLAEEERQRREEEEQRRLEEEQLRLLEEARKAEELRLHQAIEEAKKREEEEKKRREEEHKQKLEREEAEKKAKEEAEKQRIEMEIRLKKEEEDRQARRKRVEAIMLRTRGRGSTASNTTPSKEGEESEENSPPDEVKSATQSEHNDFLNSERSHSDANAPPPNNAPSPPAPLRVENNNKHNGHHNGSIDPLSENNVTNSLLDLGGPADHHLLELAAQGNGKLPEASPFIENNQSPHQVNDLLS